MSQTPITVSYSLEDVLKRIEDKIDSNQKEVNQKLEKLSQEIAVIKATLDAQQPLIQKIPDLAEKVGELKNWRQIVIIALTAVLLLGLFAGETSTLNHQIVQGPS